MKLILIALVAVAALVLALWPVVADAPWEDGLTEEQIYETIGAEIDAKSIADADETEVERLAKCDAILRLVTQIAAGGSAAPLVQAEIARAVIENHC